MVRVSLQLKPKYFSPRPGPKLTRYQIQTAKSSDAAKSVVEGIGRS